MTKRTVRAGAPSTGEQLIAFAVSWLISVGFLVIVVVPLLAISFALFKSVMTNRGEWPQVPEWITALR